MKMYLRNIFFLLFVMVSGSCGLMENDKTKKSTCECPVASEEINGWDESTITYTKKGGGGGVQIKIPQNKFFKIDGGIEGRYEDIDSVISTANKSYQQGFEGNFVKGFNKCLKKYCTNYKTICTNEKLKKDSLYEELRVKYLVKCPDETFVSEEVLTLTPGDGAQPEEIEPDVLPKSLKLEVEAIYGGNYLMVNNEKKYIDSSTGKSTIEGFKIGNNEIVLSNHEGEVLFKGTIELNKKSRKIKFNENNKLELYE